MPLTSREKQNRRREALDEIAAAMGYASHYRMMTAIINGEIEMKRIKSVSLIAEPGQSAFDALDEAIRDGEVSQNAQVGGVASETQGWFPRPENAIGTISLGARRRRWIVIPD